MAVVSVKKNSRLVFSTLREFEGFTFLEVPKLPKIEQAEDDLVHVVESTDRIDNLAYRYYGTPTLWWVIALANGMRLLPRDMKRSDRLSIPSRTRVLSKILTKAK